MMRTTIAAVLLLASSITGAAALDLTPAQTEGPYYPRRKPTETDADLTRIGNGPVAKGVVLVLAARVVDPDGKPIEGARVEIWQTDAQGIYLHPDDPKVRNRDPNFQSFGEARTSGEGQVRFTTIRPPPYEGRPSHIHVKVTPPGGRTLTTQLYFADDPALARDGIARRLGKALERVTLSPKTGEQGRQEAAALLVVSRSPSAKK